MFILSSKAEHAFLPRLAAPLIAGALATLAFQHGAQAAPETFIVADQEGYGISECLKGRAECGRIVADAWCESHGHGPASAFGLAEDVTASVPGGASRQSIPADATIVACSD
ncbi:MAG: hypothetical protein ACR652_16015 [Methylocystis sp.]|uniref:hypothetical protein n=1 Tax=Methylocystis sp. TaxID=1911079 RepID=UPI003DA593C2